METDLSKTFVQQFFWKDFSSRKTPVPKIVASGSLKLKLSRYIYGL